MRSLTLGLLLTAGTLSLLGVVGYAVHFDKKRRSDPNFRKAIRREKKKAEKAKKVSAEKAKEANAETVANLLKVADSEELPTAVDEREAYFMQQVGQGEALAAQATPQSRQQAAVCFYRALKVYPSPVELIMIYQKTVPKEIFDLVMALFAADMKKKQDQYYESFPPRDMNVVVKEFEAGVSTDGTKIIRKGLTAARDLKEGEVVYLEEPVTSALHPALEGAFCNFCLKTLPEDAFDITETIEKVVEQVDVTEKTNETEENVGETSQTNDEEADAVKEQDEQIAEAEAEPMEVFETTEVVTEKKSAVKTPRFVCDGTDMFAFCSGACKTRALSEYRETLCFGDDSTSIDAAALDLDDVDAVAAATGSGQKMAKLIQYCKDKNITHPLLIARFLVHMAREENKTEPVSAEDTEKRKDDAENHSTWDHIERLRYLEVPADEDLAKEIELLKGAVGSKVEGLDEFINGERYACLKGKMLYNCLAVHTGDAGESKPLNETLRGSSSSMPTGTALYKVTSYIAHSCSPNARVTFPKGTRELTIVANRDISAGDELRVSFIPGAEEKSAADRRTALADAWRFRCACAKCSTDE